MSGPYSIILCDPPWEYKVWSAKGAGRTAASHYPTMTTAEIAAVPVGKLAAENAVLLIWATWPKLPDALEVIRAWGFVYQTCAFCWVKQHRHGWGWHLGLGHYTRANTEPCLLATKGNTLPRLAHDVSQLIVAPIRQHSRKPDAQYEKIERLFGPLPRVELFARRPWAGWDAMGHGVSGGMDIGEQIEQCARATAA